MRENTLFLASLACACCAERAAILEDNRGVPQLRLGSKGIFNTSPVDALATTLRAFSPAIGFQAPSANLRRRPFAFHRHEPPIAREIAFVANSEVASPPFTPGRKSMSEFLARDSTVQIIMSQADGFKRLDPGASKYEQRWEVYKKVPFPGMMAKAATPTDIRIDSTTPSLQASSTESRVVCEGGPFWARGILERIGQIGRTTSKCTISLRDAPGGKTFVATVNMETKLNIPQLLPIPVGVFSKAGSDSIQNIFDKEMPTALKNLQEAYVKWSAEEDSN